MSKINLFSNPLSAASRVTYDIDPGTRLIDWLQEHYPDGFNGMLRVFVGVDELNIEDLDYAVQDQEQITMLVMPGGGGLLASLAIQAVVSIAIGYIINLIFGPEVPSGYESEKQSPIYSLAPTPNTARLGEPIEVHYGRVSTPPPFAAAPYEMYDGGSNDMYVDQLHCLGHGTFEIHDIYIGDTPIDQMEVGTVQYWQIPPSIHNNSENQVEDYVNNYLAQTGNPISFIANCYTCPEVEDWLFNDTLGNVYDTPQAFAGSAYAASTDATTGLPIPAHISNVDVTLTYPKDEQNPDNPQTGPFGAGIEVGDYIELAGTTVNNFVFRIGSIVPDPADPVNKVVLYQNPADEQLLVDEVPLNAAATFTLNETSVVSNMIAGPYRAQKEGQQIDRVFIDIEFPIGLYHVDKDDDRLTTNSVTMRVHIQQIDETTGAPIGVPGVHDQKYSSKKRDPIRDTIELGLSVAGAYEISVERINPISDNDRDIEEAHWTGLRSRVVPEPSGVYSDTTLLAVRMKATNGLGGAARSRLRVVMSRDKIFNDLNTYNPTVALKDIWNNPIYGLNRPLDELHPDIDVIGFSWELNGPIFNGSFSEKNTGMEAMQQVVSLAGARVIQEGGLVNVVPDQAQSVRKALYSSANTIKDSFTLDYNFDTNDSYDHIELEYRDPVTWQPRYATYPLTGGSYPDTYKLFGCTDQTYAEQFARYLDNVKQRRRKIARFKVEADGFLVRFGHRIGVASSVPYWGHSGVVIEVISATELRLDGPLPWTSNNVMILRDEYGGQLGQYSVTQGISANRAVFGEAIVAHGPEGLDPTNYIFGEDSTLIRDFLVTKVSPDTETTVAIEAQVYDEFVFEGGPPQMNPPATTCKEYECDALSGAIKATSPDFYYPMNIQSDIDNYATAPNPIIDYAGSGNHLRFLNGRPGGTASTLEINTCSGVMTGAASGDYNLLRTDQGDTIAGGMTSSDGASMIFHPGGVGSGDKIYGEIRWTNAGGWDNGIRAIWYSPSGRIRWTISNINQVDSGGSGIIEFDYSTIDANWASGMLGIRAYQDGTRIMCDLYLNFVQVHSQLVPLSNGQTTQAFAAGRPMTEISSCSSGAGSEEHSVWLRKLSDAEWDDLKAAWEQNFSDYVDPNPNCAERCSALSRQLNLAFTRHWPMSDPIGSGRVTDVIVGETLENRTNINYEVAALYPDVCADIYAATGGWDNIPLAPEFDDWTVGYVGSFGGFAKITSGPATSVIALYWNSGSVGIELSNSGTDVTITLSNANQVTPIVYTDALVPEFDETTPFILLNYNVNSITGFATVELFKNFVSLGVQTTAADPTSVSQTNRYFRLNTGFTSTVTTLQNVVYSPTETSPETILALREAWLQNQSSYVDPDPNCTPA